MDDLLEKFLAARQAFGERVNAITDDQWQLGTPDVEWSVADLVAHLVDEHQWAAPLLHGHDLESAATIVDGTRTLPVDGGVGANLAESWGQASSGSVDAFSEDGALDRTVNLSRGATPVRDYISEMIFDLVVHSWDLGRAIGFGEPLPADLVDAVYTQAKGLGDLSSSGMFDAPVDVDAAAPTIDRLVALTGRDPSQPIG